MSKVARCVSGTERTPADIKAHIDFQHAMNPHHPGRPARHRPVRPARVSSTGAGPSGQAAPIDPYTPSDRRAERERPDVLAAIAAGGALGTLARYGVAQLVHVARDTFPWATFWTNVSGSFALGVLLVLLVERFPPSRYVRPFFATGLLGAFTTFSTLAVETDLLVKDGHAPIGVAYGLASLVAGLAAAWAGIVLGRTGRRPVGRS